MALPESAFQRPYWIRYKYEATLLRDDSARFDDMRYRYASTRQYRNVPIPGYNAQVPTIRADRVDLLTDAPYIRAR